MGEIRGKVGNNVACIDSVLVSKIYLARIPLFEILYLPLFFVKGTNTYVHCVLLALEFQTTAMAAENMQKYVK